MKFLVNARPRINQILFMSLFLALSGCGTGAEPGAGLAKESRAGESIKGDEAQPPVCVIDRFKQPEAPVTNKQDILFVMDNSVSMNRHWQLMAAKIGKLLKGTGCKDVRIAVMVGGIEKHTGLLFAAPKQPKVLNAMKMSEAQVMASLKKTFAYALTYDQTDWIAAGEALFYSLYYGATTKSEAIRKQGFFRPDAGLNVIFMSDDAEISYPYPSKQIWDLPPKCNWGHHEKVRKTYYVPRKITADSTFTALRQLKGDMPLVTNAFVNITRADILVDNKLDAKCIFDSPGFGYFDIVKRSGGVVWSIHRDRAEGLLQVGRTSDRRRNLIHDFHLSKPAAKVDPASIEASVDSARVEHSYKPDTNVVHLEDAGKAGSLVEIKHCEPVPQHEWTIEAFQGSAEETSAQLSWLTSQLATSGKVNYGTDPGSLNDSASHEGSATSHSVTVSGLAPNTLYHFQAVSTDEFGTEKKSEVISLRTKPAWEASELRGSAARNTAVLQWDTLTYPTAGFVRYGTSPENMSSQTPSNGTTKNHIVNVEGLSANTVYYFQAFSFDEFARERATNVIALRTAQDWAIVGLRALPGRHAAMVEWSTPEFPTDSEIRYGTHPDSLSLAQKSAEGIAIPHSANLNGLSAGTTYYYRAIAKDEFGVVKQSDLASFTTIPDWQLSQLNAVSTERTFSVGFTTTGFPTDSRLLWGKTSQLGGSVVSGSGTQEHSATVEGLEPDTLYYFQAVAVDSLGKEMRSAVGSIRTKKEVIPLPKWTISRFEGSATQTSVGLTWLTEEYPTTSTVRFGTDPANLGRSIEETDPAREHSLGVAGLEPDTLYYFQVIARDDRGQEQESAVIAVRTQMIPLPVWEIENFRGETTRDSATLSWSTSQYETSGRVRWGTNPASLDGSVNSSATARDHSVVITGLSPGTTYYFQAIGSDDRGQEKASEVISLRTQEEPLPVWEISAFTAVPDLRSISASFATEAYATRGKIRYGTAAGDLSQETSLESAAGLSHAFAITGLAPNTVYFLQAVAIDDRGQEKASQVLEVKTTFTPPVWNITGFDGTTTANQANLIWNTPGVATRAVVKVGLSPSDLSFKTVIVEDFKATHVIAVTELNPNTTYYFKVIAEDADGGQVESNVISKKTKTRGKSGN